MLHRRRQLPEQLLAVHYQADHLRRPLELEHAQRRQPPPELLQPLFRELPAFFTFPLRSPSFFGLSFLASAPMVRVCVCVCVLVVTVFPGRQDKKITLVTKCFRLPGPSVGGLAAKKTGARRTGPFPVLCASQGWLGKSRCHRPYPFASLPFPKRQ